MSWTTRRARLANCTISFCTLSCQGGYGFNLTALAQPLQPDVLRSMRVDPLAVEQTRHRLDGLVAEAVALLG